MSNHHGHDHNHDDDHVHAIMPADGWDHAYVPGPDHPSNLSDQPFSPQTIFEHEGRYIFDGFDVTDLPIWWKCPTNAEHPSYAVSLSVRTSPHDPGCPMCQVEAAAQANGD
jgi:hypothetical protein